MTSACTHNRGPRATLRANVVEWRPIRHLLDWLLPDRALRWTTLTDDGDDAMSPQGPDQNALPIGTVWDIEERFSSTGRATWWKTCVGDLGHQTEITFDEYRAILADWAERRVGPFADTP